MDNSDFKDSLRSMNGFNWMQRSFDKALSDLIKNKYSVSDKIAKILSGKKIPKDLISDFLNPKIKNSLPDPWVLKDMKPSTQYISDLITQNKKIGVFGDFDVDGITSTSIICLFLKEINCPYEFYIPDRIKEGYGPNIDAFKELKKKKCEVVITVDCGISSNKVIQKAKELSIKTVIIDHHMQVSSLPDAEFIINPNQNNDTSKLKNLAAVGVVFLFLISLKRELKKRNFFYQKTEPNLINLLDLVALGTVCDQVQQDSINRAIVKSGLKFMNAKTRLGIKYLVNKSTIREELDEFHLGFIIGPKINAGGRIGSAETGVELLMSEKMSSVEYLSEKLSKYNNERKQIERQLASSIIKNINSNSRIICVYGEKWHQGVIGIVASKITQKFHKPVIVISLEKDLGKGSCRSIKGFNMGKMIKEAKDQGILISGGGHEMAAGLLIERKKIHLLSKFVDDYPFIDDFDKMSKYFDIELDIININREFYDELENIAPYGPGNLKPIFLLRNCFLKNIRRVGHDHIACQISNVFGNTVNAIIFKAFENKIGSYIINSHGETRGLICYLRINSWSGKKNVEVEIIDIIG